MAEKKQDSSGSGTSGESHSDSSLQTVKQKLFILKAKTKSLKNAEQFLKNRDFEVISTTDIKQAIQSILGGQMAYIMLSADHPNPKVMKLPVVIQQTLNTPVILFTEGASAKGALLLRDSQHPYVLYAPVSGPAVERTILKIERDRKEKVEGGSEARSVSTEGSGLDQGAIKFSGNGPVQGQDFILQGQQKAQQELAKIFGGDFSSGSDATLNESHSSVSSVSGSDPVAEEVLDYLNSAEGDGSGRALPKFVGMNKKGDLYVTPPAKDEKVPLSSEVGASQMSGSQLSQQSRRDHYRPGGNAQDPSPNSDAGAFLPPEKVLPGVNVLTFTSDENASFLLKGSRHALESSSRFVKGRPVRKVQACSRVACFKVECSRFSGFVVVAFGERNHIDKEFNSDISRYLCEYLNTNGLSVKMVDLTSLRLKEVNFEEWSIREADFLMTSIHDGNEIALAFFPHENKEAPLELSAEAHMAKMGLEEIVADEPIEFDVYLYMAANKKYLRYTPKEGILYSAQQKRLRDKGHSKIHIRKESESDLSRYRVQNFLNSKIENFKKSRKSS